MTTYSCWEGDLPACFGNIFKAEGWNITVARARDHAEILQFKGGAEPTTLNNLSADAAPRHLTCGPMTYSWAICSTADGLQREALVFSRACGADMVMWGSILLCRDDFRGSNSRTEADLLEFISYLVQLTAKSTAAKTESLLLREFGEAFSIQLVIFDQLGEIVFESSNGIGFLCDVLGFKSVDYRRIKKKLESLIGQIQAEEVGERSAVFDLTSGARSDEELGEVPRYKLIKLYVDDEDAHVPGPYYAIVETRQPEMPDPNTLRRQFALTPAEARVVTRLIEGAPIPDISVDLRLSNHTVRTYLKRSYGKIGVNGQTQLITKMTRLSDCIGTLPKVVGA